MLIMLCSFLMSCPSDDEDECIKTITIPQIYVVGNQSYTTEIQQDVPCDFPEPDEPELIEPPRLENFTYEILSSNYVPDTGNNTTLLQFEIQLNNHSDADVSGIPWITVVTPGLEFSTASYAEDALNPCLTIDANASCNFIFDQEYPLEPVGAAESFEIINVEYIITD